MHIFFIRHGETEHNVAGLLAGITDSRLTNHGVLQTQRLGCNLIGDRGLRFTNVFSSNLQRAFMTADAICKAQNHEKNTQQIEVVQIGLLREQDFGSLELVSWSSRKAEDARNPRATHVHDPDFVPSETSEAMNIRASSFIEDYIVPLLIFDDEQPTRMAIVSHGIFLSRLWKVLVSKFEAKDITLSSNIAASKHNRPLDHVSWSNTGYLEVKIRAPSMKVAESDTPYQDNSSHSLLSRASMIVHSVNETQHLLSLRRARGGIGSAAHDQRQQKLTTFFNKSKVNLNAMKHVAKPPTSRVSGPADVVDDAPTLSNPDIQK